MKILLDNCVDFRAKALFEGQDVFHVLDLGWEALSNGRLIAAAASQRFEVLVTVDKNIRFQQNLGTLPISIVELDVVKNRMDEIARLRGFLPLALAAAQKHRFVRVRVSGEIETIAPIH